MPRAGPLLQKPEVDAWLLLRLFRATLTLAQLVYPAGAATMYTAKAKPVKTHRNGGTLAMMNPLRRSLW
jgi:hypothetical protein